ATHDLAQYDSQLTRLAIQGRMGTEEQMALRHGIQQVSMASGQSREEILGGLDAIVERTGDLKFATEVMADMAVASTATGAAMGDLGALASNLQQKMGLATDEIRTAFGILTSQGKAGAFTLENMATMGERLFAAAGRFGVKGMGGIKQFGALVQMARMGTGSSEQATTAIEGAMADIIDKAEILRSSGFSIFKPGTKNEMKSVEDVFKGIIKLTGGDVTKLQKIFGRESIRGVSAIAQAYKETGGFAMFDKLAEGGDPSELMRDFARYSQSSVFQFQQLRNIGVEFLDKAISPMLAKTTIWLRNLTSSPEKLEELRERLGAIAGGLQDGIAGAAEILRPVLFLLQKSAEGWGAVLDKFASERRLRETRERREESAMDMWNKYVPADVKREYARKKRAGEETDPLERIAMQYATRAKLEQQNNVNLTVQVDANGRVTSTSDDPNTALNVNQRGSTAFAGQ
ncbi:MAG TPA: phage tail tape measure protein, partial [Acidobacteriaceae bacterium]|nr:phage tail tape measure protein [Acidobacteriaceae bacterium]